MPALIEEAYGGSGSDRLVELDPAALEKRDAAGRGEEEQ